MFRFTRENLSSLPFELCTQIGKVLAMFVGGLSPLSTCKPKRLLGGRQKANQEFTNTVDVIGRRQLDNT